MDFVAFREAIAKQFDRMNKGDLFCANVERDDLWDNYLGSFPEGTNPVLRKRTEHDCSCCRGFIKTVGNVVSVAADGELVSVWDVQIGDPAYQAVADSMASLVKSASIKDAFLHYEANVGKVVTYEAGEPVQSWSHFHVKLPDRRNSGKNYVAAKDQIPTLLGDARTNQQVFLSSLKSITIDALETVLELISQNTLYRGTENKGVVDAFLKLKRDYEKLSPEKRNAFAWAHANNVGGSVARIKNTAIGTLLENLSPKFDDDGKVIADSDELEDAVRKYESVVAPQNYKRSSSLVSKAQVEKAKAKIEELGLTSALSRRYARLSDIKVNNVLFVDRSVRTSMKGGGDVFDSIDTKQSKPKLDRVEDITIEAFIANVLPNATTVEVLFDNRQVGNLMSLIAPADPLSKNMFKWDNPFSWTYTGDVTDSIKDRVKKAGGNVTGEFCCRLAWFNRDDLDFHMTEPNGHIYFGSKVSGSGRLDVDMNVSGETREPVENIFYERISAMPRGNYTLSVHNYRYRESESVGFEVEIDHLGSVINMAYTKPVRNNEHIAVANITKDAAGLTITPLLQASHTSKEVWGVKTMEFHRVNSIMLSPNHWAAMDGEDAVGAKHYFFMLDGCKNDGGARGFYNEFLSNELNEHRKVLEIVGAKMQTESSNEQLSGLGFSATKRSEVIVRVTGAMTRNLKITF